MSQTYPLGDFRAEYAALVGQLTGGRSFPQTPGGFLHGMTPDNDRRWEYEAAVQAVPMDMGRRAIEFAAPASFFGLYASNYYRHYQVVDDSHDMKHADPALRQAWGRALSDFPDRLGFAARAEDLSTQDAPPYDVGFVFRSLENAPDDFALMAKLRHLLAHDAGLFISVAFSHAGPFEFDADAGFRVYDEGRVRALLAGFEITSWRPLESAEEVTNLPRPFDLTVLCVGAKRR